MSHKLPGRALAAGAGAGAVAKAVMFDDATIRVDRHHYVHTRILYGDPIFTYRGARITNYPAGAEIYVLVLSESAAAKAEVLAAVGNGAPEAMIGRYDSRNVESRILVHTVKAQAMYSQPGTEIARAQWRAIRYAEFLARCRASGAMPFSPGRKDRGYRYPRKKEGRRKP